MGNLQRSRAAFEVVLNHVTLPLLQDQQGISRRGPPGGPPDGEQTSGRHQYAGGYARREIEGRHAEDLVFQNSNGPSRAD